MITTVTSMAGATMPARDALDQQVASDYQNRTGDLAIDSPFYPALASGTPPTDTDHDGMPDAWENAHGLDPHDPADRNSTTVDGCYTNLEVYLNQLAGE